MMDEPPKRRGRPAGAPGHSLGQYLRRLRDARGWTVRDLAKAVGLPVTSAAYISQLESGLKVPSPELAENLERVLGDDQGIFRLWSVTGRRSDPSRAAVARRQLARLLDDPSLAHDPHFTHPLLARIESVKQRLFGLADAGAPMRFEQSTPHAPDPLPYRKPRWVPRQPALDPDEPPPPDVDRTAVRPAASEARPAMAGRPRPQEDEPYRARVPLLPEGVDPLHARTFSELERMSGGRTVRIDHDVLRAHRAEMPFAYRLGPRGSRRVTSLFRPGDIVVITRDVGRIVPHEVYAVRHEGEVVLTLLMWNGTQLLLLPDEGHDDFIVIEADEDTLHHHVIGHVATVIRGAADADHGE